MQRTTRVMVSVLCALGALSATMLWPSAASAQGIDDRIAEVRRERLAARERDSTARDEAAYDIRDNLNVLIDPVIIRNAPFEEAVRWWSETTNVPVLVNWRSLENAGIDIAAPINLQLRDAPAPRVLGLIMRMGSQDIPLIYEVTPWYIQIMTQDQANRRTVTRIYDIADLLHRIPDFDNAPDFDLSSILDSGRNSGGQSGSGSGSGGGLFGDTSNRNEDDPENRSKAERGEEIAQIIRDTIEPDIWQAHGGEHASIRYHDGRLVVKAPLYVHAQIGLPTTSRHNNQRRYLVDRPTTPRNPATGTSAVSGIDTHSTPVSGKTGE